MLEQRLYESSLAAAWAAGLKEGRWRQTSALLTGYEWALQDHAYSGEPSDERRKERIEEVRFLQGLVWALLEAEVNSDADRGGRQCA